MPGLLLDTHVIIWMATAPDRLSRKLLKAIEETDRRHVSHVTALEIQLKHAKHSKSFPFSLAQLEKAMVGFGCLELPITYNDIAMLEQMEFLHDDPFDRVLMSQSANRKLRFATADENILRTAQKYKMFLHV